MATPIIDIKPEMLTQIQSSIEELQRKITEISGTTRPDTSIPDIATFKNDIKHVIVTIDNMTKNDGTPIKTYVTSLIKDMIININNIFYEKKQDGSITSTIRLKGELDVLTDFKGYDVLKEKILEVLIEQRVPPQKQDEIKIAIKNIIPSINL